MKRSALVPVALFTISVAAPVAASPQVWPFAFDAGLAPDAAAIEQMLAEGGASLPPLPVAELTTLSTDDGTMTLWFWPENAALLQSINTAGPGTMTWPTTPVMCAQHAAFSMPTLIPGEAGPVCAATNAQIQSQLSTSNLQACILVEQPELYVYGYSPANVALDVGNIEDMIGLAGQALTVVGPPLTGILPDDWIPTMRVVLDKIRYDKLLAQLQSANAAYAKVTSLLTSHPSCFNPTAASTLQTELAGLSGEVTAITAYLQQIEQEGETANTQESQCLAAASRTRDTLDYPGLVDAEREFVAFWLGGIYWRMRGGALIPLGSTQEARLLYVGDGFGNIGALLGGSDGRKVAGPFVTELMLDGWGQWQAMGTDPTGYDKYTDLVGMTERGQRQANVGINALTPLGWDAGELLTGGLQMGPGYYFAYYPLQNFRYGATMPSPYSGFIDWPTAVGEFNMGAALGLGMARVLLPGKATGQPPTVTLCTNRVCGSDGCGGSCGTCTGGTICNGSGQCVTGTPDGGGIDASPGPDASGSIDATPGMDATGASDATRANDASGNVDAPHAADASGSADAARDVDATHRTDAKVGGQDARTPIKGDARATHSDTGTREAPQSSTGGGCGCRVASRASPAAVAVLPLLIVAGALRRRIVRRRGAAVSGGSQSRR